MGTELDTPILTKNSIDKETRYIKYGSCSVQGWKTMMEEFNFFMGDIYQNTDKKIDIFGLFCGDGGPEVAKYICNTFPDKLKSNNNFKEGKYIEALKETFIEVDNSLNSDKAKIELKKIEEEFKLNDNEEEIELINKTCGKGESLPDRELEQIKCIKDLLNPRKLKDYNISFFSGCSGMVIIISNEKIYIANIGNIRCIPIDTNLEIISEKVTKINLVSDESEKKRILFSQEFKEKKIYSEFIETSREFGLFDYKENKWLKQEDQTVSCEPDIMELDYDKIKYLIIGSNGLFEQGDISDEIFYNKCNRKLAEYFIEKINKRKDDKKISKIIEEYLDRIIPKTKNNNIEFKYKNYMSNISCSIIQPLSRPKMPENIEEKKMENDKIKVNTNSPKENQRQENFKKKSNNHRSMKNLFSFLKNTDKGSNCSSIGNINSSSSSKIVYKIEKKENKKLESSSSFTNIFKKK